jgi:hypothetical protein
MAVKLHLVRGYLIFHGDSSGGDPRTTLKTGRMPAKFSESTLILHRRKQLFNSSHKSVYGNTQGWREEILFGCRGFSFDVRQQNAGSRCW